MMADIIGCLVYLCFAATLQSTYSISDELANVITIAVQPLGACRGQAADLVGSLCLNEVPKMIVLVFNRSSINIYYCIPSKVLFFISPLVNTTHDGKNENLNDVVIRSHSANAIHLVNLISYSPILSQVGMEMETVGME